MSDASDQETQINKPQRILLVILLALTPIFIAQAAFAQTKDEYTAQIAVAQAKVDAAQNALKKAEDALSAAQQLLSDTTVALNEADRVVQDKTATLLQKQDAVTAARLAVEEAQANYDNNLIDDPTWVPLTHEVENTRLVSNLEWVQKTSLVQKTVTNVTGGVTAQVYNRLGYNAAPPLPGANEQPIYTTIVPNIDFNWGGGEILGSGRYEDVIVKFTGNLLFPEDGNYSFYTPADDGTKLTIAGMNLIDDWRDKGGGGSISQSVFIRGGVLYPFTLYYYENGGGAAVGFYQYTPDFGFIVIPPEYLGSQSEEVVVWVEETTWVEELVWTEETFFTTEVIPNQVAPKIKDPALLALIEEPTTIYNNAVTDYNSAQLDLATAEASLKVLQEEQSKNVVTIDVAQENVNLTEQAVIDAQSELEAIPPLKDPTPTPEKTKEPVKEPEEVITPEVPEPNTPTPTELPVNIETVNPQELTAEQVTELISVANEILKNSEQGSPEYEQALEAFFVAAKADDIVVDENLAAIPLLGSTAVALANAINFMGNVGADMSPKVREESEKIVVTAVVAVGAAVNAATGAALTASAPAPGAGSNNIRRND